MTTDRTEEFEAAALRHAQIAGGLEGRLSAERTLTGHRSAPALAALVRIIDAHHPAECVNARCATGQWCIGCDPDGGDDCSEHSWFRCPIIDAVVTEFDMERTDPR